MAENRRWAAARVLKGVKTETRKGSSSVKRRTQEKMKAGDALAAGEGYVDKAAVAKRLGVKPKTVAEWANQGKLPAYRIGSYLRFKWAEVEQHLAATARVCRPA